MKHFKCLAARHTRYSLIVTALLALASCRSAHVVSPGAHASLRSTPAPDSPLVIQHELLAKAAANVQAIYRHYLPFSYFVSAFDAIDDYLDVLSEDLKRLEVESRLPNPSQDQLADIEHLTAVISAVEDISATSVVLTGAGDINGDDLLEVLRKSLALLQSDLRQDIARIKALTKNLPRPSPDRQTGDRAANPAPSPSELWRLILEWPADIEREDALARWAMFRFVALNVQHERIRLELSQLHDSALGVSSGELTPQQQRVDQRWKLTQDLVNQF